MIYPLSINRFLTLESRMNGAPIRFKVPEDTENIDNLRTGIIIIAEQELDPACPTNRQKVAWYDKNENRILAGTKPLEPIEAKRFCSCAGKGTITVPSIPFFRPCECLYDQLPKVIQNFDVVLKQIRG
jgi:hypothetical protein